jgi:ABC-type multidrug transport system fused ATPase/permease subunit
VAVPITFKTAIDSLNGIPAEPVFAIFGGALVAYGLARFGSSLFSEIRNAVFSLVAQSAIRSASKNIFSHLHTLDLEYHNSTQTGALVRSIDRGAKGVFFFLILANRNKPSPHCNGLPHIPNIPRDRSRLFYPDRFVWVAVRRHIPWNSCRLHLIHCGDNKLANQIPQDYECSG